MMHHHESWIRMHHHIIAMNQPMIHHHALPLMHHAHASSWWIRWCRQIIKLITNYWNCNTGIAMGSAVGWDVWIKTLEGLEIVAPVRIPFDGCRQVPRCEIHCGVDVGAEVPCEFAYAWLAADYGPAHLRFIAFLFNHLGIFAIRVNFKSIKGKIKFSNIFFLDTRGHLSCWRERPDSMPAAQQPHHMPTRVESPEFISVAGCAVQLEGQVRQHGHRSVTGHWLYVASNKQLS